MPRDGSGRAHNAIEPDHNIVHGNDNAPTDDPASSGVDRSYKAADLPEAEKGEAIEGMKASGGESFGWRTQAGSGKGPLEPTVDKVAEEVKKS